MPVSSPTLWTWHRWLGLSILVPLLWWTGTALVFALRPMEEIHGKTWSTGRKAEPAPLATATLPSPAGLSGAHSLTARVVEGREVLAVDRGAAREPEVVDLATGRTLGPAIPLEWALAAARRDFAGAFEVEGAWLYPRHGDPRRVLGGGPGLAPGPDEFVGARPAYAIALRGWPGMHLWVDALDGQVRARRTTLWRFYDGAFRLHALDFLPDGWKRAVMWLVVLAWLALAATGFRLALAWLGRRRPASPARGRPG